MLVLGKRRKIREGNYGQHIIKRNIFFISQWVNIWVRLYCKGVHFSMINVFKEKTCEILLEIWKR